MSTLIIPRPEADEAASFYQGYITKVRGENLGDQLGDQLQEVERLFTNLTDAEALARYADGKWSIKEVLGHLSDTERIFSYRHENAYVPAGNFDRRPLPTLLAEFRAVRLSTAAMVEGGCATAMGSESQDAHS